MAERVARVVVLQKRTFENWHSPLQLQRDVLPMDHGIVVSASKSYTRDACKAVCAYIDDIAATNGHSLPIHMRPVDGAHEGACVDNDSAIVLPPRHSLRSLHGAIQACRVETQCCMKDV